MKSRRGRFVRSLRIAVLAVTLAGCAASRPEASRLPAEHLVQSRRLMVHTDFPLSEDDPLLAELDELRQRVRQTLELPEQRRPVVVYLFEDEDRYNRYMSTVYPELPPRRAFFIGTPGELAVYAYLGEQVREDLRHEYTHGLLHASLRRVPLWLDEGLAEYFEVTTPHPRRINTAHADALAEMIRHGWTPNLPRLEQLEDISEMQRADYQESWAWVHYLLHESDDTRQILIDYLHQRRTDEPADSLAAVIEAEIPQPAERLRSYIAGCSSGGVGHVVLERLD